MYIINKRRQRNVPRSYLQLTTNKIHKSQKFTLKLSSSGVDTGGLPSLQASVRHLLQLVRSGGARAPGPDAVRDVLRGAVPGSVHRVQRMDDQGVSGERRGGRTEDSDPKQSDCQVVQGTGELKNYLKRSVLSDL